MKLGMVEDNHLGIEKSIGDKFQNQNFQIINDIINRYSKKNFRQNPKYYISINSSFDTN